MLKTYVKPSGPPDAKIALVGEQPGYQEIRRGIPFIGPAGEELTSCCQLVPINRMSMYITNVIKDLDKPLEHYVDLKNQHFNEEGEKYLQMLKEELTSVNPNIIIACGNVALLALCSRTGITKWRGSVIESTLIMGKKVIPILHPATIIPPKNVYTNKWLIVNDLKRAVEQSQFPEFRTTSRRVTVCNTFREASGWLDYLYESGLGGNILDIDIEVVGEEISCLALTDDPTHAYVIAFLDNNGDTMRVDEEAEIWKQLALIIEDERIAKRGANFIFDCSFFLQRYGIRPRGDIHCTQIAQRIAFPDYPANLAFVTSMHSDIPYYKDDGKKWMKVGGSWDTFWEYNGFDAMATAASHPSQMIDLMVQKNVETYDRQRKLIPPLLYMSARGIKVDVLGMIKEKEETKLKIEELAEKLNSLVGYEINYNSPKQLQDYFYTRKGLKPYKKRGTKAVTTDVDAMKRLARRGFEEARIILDLRQLSKRLSVYLDPTKLDNDGRFRTAYKPDGAETGRLSSGETIFGTGGNQQNWPHDLLRYFIADNGYVIYSIDLSQVENRIVAYVGNVTQMIEAFETGRDVHRLTASLIFNKPFDEISDEDGSCDLGDGRQSERFWGKKANHGLNYDLGYRSFALYYELPERDASFIVERYHAAYPGVRHNYHAMIQSQLVKHRSITNLMGRTRVFMDSLNDKTFKAAYAHIPQSSTADKVNEHGLEYIYFNQDLFKPVELLAQVHDSVVFQIPLSIPWSEHARIITAIKQSLETPFKWKDIQFSVPADTAVGLNMCKADMEEIKAKKFPSTLEELAKRLEDIYGKLSKTPRLD